MIASWGGPWYARCRDRCRFERNARWRFRSLRSRLHRPSRYVYHAELEPPGCPSRRARIEFTPDRLYGPRVFVDGPKRSPHRFPDESLCMWRETDSVERRWVFSDGLVALLGQIQNHLVREHLWRLWGEWPGDEAPHTTQSDLAA